jgi:hypothetical protein
MSESVSNSSYSLQLSSCSRRPRGKLRLAETSPDTRGEDPRAPMSSLVNVSDRDHARARRAINRGLRISSPNMGMKPPA